MATGLTVDAAHQVGLAHPVEPGESEVQRAGDLHHELGACRAAAGQPLQHDLRREDAGQAEQGQRELRWRT